MPQNRALGLYFIQSRITIVERLTIGRFSHLSTAHGQHEIKQPIVVAIVTTVTFASNPLLCALIAWSLSAYKYMDLTQHRPTYHIRFIAK